MVGRYVFHYSISSCLSSSALSLISVKSWDIWIGHKDVCGIDAGGLTAAQRLHCVARCSTGLLWYLEDIQDVGGGGREEGSVVLVLVLGLGLSLGLGHRCPSPHECHPQATMSYDIILS
jgi:hypothetical protein